MTIVLGDNRYGKAETHVVRITKSGPGGKTHEIKDLNVSVSLVGDFAASHLVGDNSSIVPTDTQKKGYWCAKFVVPSSGSMIHFPSPGPEGPDAPDSSARMA